jgi:hypothetical protein
MRSRVMPGSSPTIERRLLVSRLKSVDLPTLGRPTMATSGSAAAPRLRRHNRSAILRQNHNPRPAHPARVLRARRHPGALAAALRIPPRPARNGQGRRARPRRAPPPDRRGRHRHRQNPGLPAARPAHRPARHRLHRHQGPAGPALLPRHSLSSKRCSARCASAT